MQQLPYHVLDFFYDEESSNCALTILADQTRLHIIAEIDRLECGPESGAARSAVAREYLRLLGDLQHANAEEGSCSRRDESTDSGIDMSTRRANSSRGTRGLLVDDRDAEGALHQWLTSPLESTISEVVKNAQNKLQQLTLEGWYNLETRFFALKVDGDGLQAAELKPLPDLGDRMLRLWPKLTPVPKYIRDIDVPWFSAKDLEVISCSSSPAPYHPSIVRLPPLSSSDESREQELFFKVVDNSNPQPTKREISLLEKLEKKGLRQKIRCTQLKGIVTAEGDGRRDSIMGFLQTLIPEPEPLTEHFDSSIPQRRREKWAREAEEMKSILHEHGIIWGDAKGDNFVVDSSGELWIIDFGGSYTQGWVDPDLMETKEGDDMGVEKVVNALHDPDENVARDGGEEEGAGTDATTAKKRKSVVDEGLKSPKRQKMRTSHSAVGDAPRYCYCSGPSKGKMIGCDGAGCAREWFHVECTDLEEMPDDEEAWFCRDCKSMA